MYDSRNRSSTNTVINSKSDNNDVKHKNKPQVSIDKNKRSKNAYAQPDFNWVSYLSNIDFDSDISKIPFCHIDKDWVLCKKKFNGTKLEIKFKTLHFKSTRDIKI